VEASIHGSRDVAPVLLISVEEYFQARAFRGLVTPGEWDALPSRVELGVDPLLELLERRSSRATFFFNAWSAVRRPGLVARVADAGHEVAALGGCDTRGRSSVHDGTMASPGRVRHLLEDLSGRPVRGFRCSAAGPDSVGPRLFESLVEEGYSYDASRVEAWPWERARWKAESDLRVIQLGEGALLELPTTKLKLFGIPLLPACGAVLRHVPPRIVASGLRAFAEEGRRPFFHLHTWEMDPQQPELPVPPIDKLRHYGRLSQTADRLDALLTELRFDSMAGEFGMDTGSSRRQAAG
jgi:polysaccharide deacetylase family protein (PEP-CTERM system associated)